MCGIAGAVARPGHTAPPAWLETVAHCLAHRGPDDFGFLQWSDGQGARVGRELDRGPCRVGLAHRRLAILDLTELAWQPMSSADGRHHLVYNGEIYTYVELR
ncbi:MAG TPA: hypothetical protein VNY84_03695, partial [Acidimicrobiales bacterium]|nr:hypothetical protein [Acidimicrobiales bacterium]